MKLEYTVTENDYITLLAGLIRIRDNRPLRRVAFLLLTVGQMAVIAWLCLTRLAPEQRPFFIVWSVLLAAFTVLRRRTVRARAKGTLYRLKADGQLPEDYWKPHRLEEKKDGLALSYGGVRLLCPPGQLTHADEADGLLYLRVGDAIFDIVPLTAFASDAEKQAFLAQLDAFCARDALPEEPAAPEEGELSLSYALDDAEFLRTQVAAFRAVYLRYQLTKPMSLVSMAVSVFLLVYAAARPSAATIALAIAFFLLLNRSNLTVLTPLARLRIRRELGAWHGGEMTLTAGLWGVRYTDGTESVTVPYAAIDVSGDAKIGRILSWGRFPAIVIPAEIRDTAEGRAILDYIADRRSESAS